MSRYIDISDLSIPSDENDYDELVAFADKVAEMITDAPSIDIVRCQDCRHRYMDADLQVWTCTYGLMIKPNGFCNYGEVRDE